MNDVRIAVLLPCYNEAAAITKVIKDFSARLPGASIIVLDNNSTDDTASLARAAGAQVISVSLQGKGNVVRRGFAEIDADVYLLVDGDDTYDALAAPQLIRHLLEACLDMLVGSRSHQHVATTQLAAYQLRLMEGSCRQLPSFIGKGLYPYQWCRVERQP